MDRVRHAAKELLSPPSPGDKSRFESALSHARISYARRYFPGHEDPLGRLSRRPSLSRRPPVRAYSNLYRRELKDYVINGLNYGVGYDRFDVSIRKCGERPAVKCVPR